MTKAEFIATIAPCAVKDMQATGVPASLTIAQAALESGWGSSGLTKQANNLFGIKGSGTAGSCTMPTKEYVNGKQITVNAAFRAYHNWSESVADHSKLILNGTKDKPMRYHGVLNADYKTAAAEIRKGGYATDPNYTQLLINIIEQYKLYQYDIKEGEQPMTATEQKEFQELKSTIKQQAEWIKSQKELTEMPCPSWAKDAYAFYKPYIADEKGSYDFWRQLVINYRKENNIIVNK
ncbi:glycoside hydrolase family 73 protein [Paenibacillus dokdonensis]|uniref:glycoside hydrolase family 73 protein n=1 Tax=Paenibacillus dokdonensis TaxID=2567944 RepID=UPI0010A77FCA|nr:glycoside hydrolase family 73 protein [Paenibacillus dokdonensis]